MAQDVYWKTRDSMKPYAKQAFFSASVTWQCQKYIILWYVEVKHVERTKESEGLKERKM